MKEIFGPKNKQILYLSIVIIVLILASIPSIYFYNQYKRAQQMLENPNVVAREELTGLVEKIGKLIELPKNEVPTLATVSDKTKLEKNAFYANAENGDKLLIYPIAKKAILYRPSTNKIIDVSYANVSVPSQNPSTSSAPSLTPTKEPENQDEAVRILLLNGTKKIGITTTAEKEITTAIKEKVDIVDKDNAEKNDYAKNVIVNLSSANTEVLTKLEDLFESEAVKTLPEGELRPKDTDVVIILGTQYFE